MDRNWKKWKGTRPLGRRRLEIREKKRNTRGAKLKNKMKKMRWVAWEIK